MRVRVRGATCAFVRQSTLPHISSVLDLVAGPDCGSVCIVRAKVQRELVHHDLLARSWGERRRRSRQIRK